MARPRALMIAVLAVAVVALLPAVAEGAPPWPVSLKASGAGGVTSAAKLNLPDGGYLFLHASTNRKVDEPFFWSIRRVDGNVNLGDCDNGPSSSYCERAFQTAGPATHRYIASINEDLGGGRSRVLASSNQVTVTWRAPTSTTTAKKPTRTTITAKKAVTTTAKKAATTTTAKKAVATTTAPSGVVPGDVGRVVFSAAGPLVTADPDGTDRKTIVADGRNSFPAWSPQRDRIAFMRAPTLDYNLYEIYVVRSDGSGLARVTDNNTYDADPTWSPDGRRLAFVSAREAQTGEQIWVMNADGTGVVSTGVRGGAPAWSPDGRRIAYVTSTGGVAVMALDGSGVSRLTGADLVAGSPGWSPNGKQLAFVAGPTAGGQMSVYVIDVAGGAPRRLTPPAHFLQTVAWSPNGSRIIYDQAASDDGNMEILIVDVATGRPGPTVGAGFGPDW